MDIKDYTLNNTDFKNFECPHCKIFSQMRSTHVIVNQMHSQMAWYTQAEHQLSISTCQSCGNSALWWDGLCVYPEVTYKLPNPDMPESVKMLYLEASSIYDKSPRAACALLRLAVEQFRNELGETGAIDKMIGSLVQKGLPTIVQKALDAVRVIGNKAVHPGQIAFDVDDKSTAETLMKLLNIITERMISEPKEINGIFDALPQSAKDSIKKRDSKC